MQDLRVTLGGGGLVPRITSSTPLALGSESAGAEEAAAPDAPFRLDLSDRERRDRDRVPLPYLRCVCPLSPYLRFGVDSGEWREAASRYPTSGELGFGIETRVVSYMFC